MQDLERIRMLESRIRKKPLIEVRKNEDEDKSQNQPELDRLAESSLKSTEVVCQIQPKKIIFQKFSEPPQRNSEQEEEDRPQGLIPEQPNNRKLTEYYPKQKAKMDKLQSKEQLRQERIDKYCNKSSAKSASTSANVLELQRQLLEKEQNELCLKERLSSCQSTIDENQLLRERLRQKQEQLTTFKTQIRSKILSTVLENHRYKRNELRAKISNNKIRLGEFVTCREGGKTQELWVDGSEIRIAREKLDEINNQKEELEKQKKNIKPKKGDDDLDSDSIEKRNSIMCQVMMLSKEETHLKELFAKLQEEKALHLKEYKMMFEEDHSKYGRPNQQTGIVHWPKISQYQLLCLLGKGGFSEVYKAFDTEKLIETACKIHEFSPTWSLEAKQNYVKHALRQNSVHKKLEHPNIVRLYNTVEIDTTSFCTVLEYCEGPDLSYYLKKYKIIQQKQAKLLIRQVMNAIKYLHSLPQKIIHYDLKPQNILFHNGQIKITDFGLCKIMNDEVTRMQLTSQGVGTYWYLPPECFFIDEKPIISVKVDIWSIGVIYFEMLFGQKPFGQKMSQMRILKQGIILKSAQVQFPSKPANISQESKDFIKQCLNYKQQQRPDITDILNHPLFDKK